MSNNVWKLADVLEAQAVADLIDIVSVEEIRENIGGVTPTILMQILNKSTDKTFVRVLNTADIETLAVLWTDQKVQERARNLGFKEPVLQSDKKLEDFIDVPNDHKRKPKTSDQVQDELDKGLAQTQGNLIPELSPEYVKEFEATSKPTKKRSKKEEAVTPAKSSDQMRVYVRNEKSGVFWSFMAQGLSENTFSNTLGGEDEFCDVIANLEMKYNGVLDGEGALNAIGWSSYELTPKKFPKVLAEIEKWFNGRGFKTTPNPVEKNPSWS